MLEPILVGIGIGMFTGGRGHPWPYQQQERICKRNFQVSRRETGQGLPMRCFAFPGLPKYPGVVVFLVPPPTYLFSGHRICGIYIYSVYQQRDRYMV